MVGYIYVFWNPAMPNMVKLGYSTDVRQRLDNANSSTMVPLPFRLYATYEVSKNVADKVLHHLLDILNPGLHIYEMLDGKKRVREFFKISKENAYLVLKSIAVISDTEDKLKKYDDEGSVIAGRCKKSFYDALQDKSLCDSPSMATLYSECVPKITDYVDGAVSKDVAQKADADDTPVPVEEKLPVEQANDNVKESVPDAVPEVPDNDELRVRFENVFIERSSDTLDMSYGCFSFEWELVGVNYDSRECLPCETCGVFKKYLFVLRNWKTNQEIALCRDCIDVRPKGSYANHFSLTFIWDVLVLEDFYNVRDDVLKYGEFPYYKVKANILTVLVRLGCISADEARRYVEKHDMYPLYGMKNLTAEEKVKLQELCDNVFVPFLKDDSVFNELRFPPDRLHPVFDFDWIRAS